MPTTVLLADTYLTSASQLSLANVGTGSAFTQAGNRLSGHVRSQMGKAVLETRGSFTGLVDRDYTVTVQSTDATGTFAGTLWQWSDGTTGGTGLTPVPGVWVAMSDGVEGRWVQTTVNPQFSEGDTIQFRAHCPTGVAALLDLVRNTHFLSGGVASGMQAAVVADLGTARSPTACVVLDHTLIAGTQVRLWSSATSNFSAHETYSLTYQADRMGFLFTPTVARRYWALVMVIQSGQSPIRLSEWYLGSHTALSLPWNIGFTEVLERTGSLDDEVIRYGPGRATPYRKRLHLTFGPRRDAVGQDTAVLRALWEQLNAWQINTLRPFYLMPDDTLPNTVGLYHWANNLDLSHAFLDRYSVVPELTEVLRAVA